MPRDPLSLAWELRLQQPWRQKYRANNPRPGGYDPATESAKATTAVNSYNDWLRRNGRDILRAAGVPDFTIQNLMTAAEFVPGVGDALDVQDAGNSIAEAWRNPTWGNLGGAGLMGAAALASIVPAGGDAAKSVLKRAAKKTAKRKVSTALPDLRNLSVDEAVSIARKQPHLIKAPEGGKSYYVGGPERIQSPQHLTAMRRDLDATIEGGADAGDWYDRTREFIGDVAGPDPRDQTWMSRQNAMYSAGVGPEVELNYALKDNNATLATGHPGKPARPAQAEYSQRAVAANDPMQHMLGNKTGMYGKKINPAEVQIGHNGGPPLTHATGVNDRWHARQLGYTENEGFSGPAAHRFQDYETALSVGRANAKGLAGRTDWTGEQVQAAAWVKARADAKFDAAPASYMKRAKEALGLPSSAPDTPEVEGMARRIAFADSNKTIADYYDKHAANATHEYQPYAGAMESGHLPGLQDAPYSERAAYAAARHAQDVDELGRDRLYAGMRHRNASGADTGVAMRVGESLPMQGVYTPPSGVVETNPGYVARPLVAFDTSDVGRALPEADKAILDAVEATRGLINVQGATPWHMTWQPKTASLANGVVIERPKGIADLEELLRVGQMGNDLTGTPNAIDVGRGFTLANFEDGDVGRLTSATPAKRRAALQQLSEATGGSARPARVESGYPGYEGAWEQGVGSDAATRQFLEYADALPDATRAALNGNTEASRQALSALEVDASLAQRYGGTREDVQFMRKLIGQGEGWIDRLRDAVGKGLLPAALAAAVLTQARQDRDGSGDGGS